MTRADILRVAAEAVCDPRTVAKFTQGQPVRALAAERIREAMRRLKIK